MSKCNDSFKNRPYIFPSRIIFTKLCARTSIILGISYPNSSMSNFTEFLASLQTHFSVVFLECQLSSCTIFYQTVHFLRIFGKGFYCVASDFSFPTYESVQWTSICSFLRVVLEWLIAKLD